MYRYQAARRAGSSARYGVCALVGASPAIRSSTAMQCGARAAHPGQSVALPGSRSSVAATSRSVTSLAWVGWLVGEPHVRPGRRSDERMHRQQT